MRAYDAEKNHWSIWWVDSRYMSLMGEPAIGRFENGVGNFYSDYTDPQGKTVRGRLNWSQITPTSARWEQSSVHRRRQDLGAELDHDVPENVGPSLTLPRKRGRVGSRACCPGVSCWQRCGGRSRAALP